MNIFYLIGGVGVAIGLYIMFRGRSTLQDATQSQGTGQARSAQKLRTEKLQTDIILNAIEDGVALVDSRGIISLYNPGASKITGWDIDEATGFDHTIVLQFANTKNQIYDSTMNPINQVLNEGKPLSDNNSSLILRSKRVVNVSLTVSPLLDQDSEVTGAIAIFRDTSEERGEERQRAEFISTASHEMRTPVAAIEGYLALALNEKVSTIDPRARTYLQKAQESTKSLGRLFSDLLVSAKAEDGRLSNHPVLVEMSAFLDGVCEDLRFIAEKKSLEMEYIVGTTGASIATNIEGSRRVVQPLYYSYVDAERIREAISNLFDNAVKYTPKGKISIGITGDEKVVQIYVRDTGEGIPPEDIPHLFQKFYRVDNSNTRTINGTGLGLFIARKIVELYNGKIWVESKQGEGSTFYINLPRLQKEQIEMLRRQQHELVQPEGAPRWEDDEDD